MAFALLLLLAKRFQPLDKSSKHQAWFNRVFSVVIMLLAAGGVAVSSCSGCIVFVAGGTIAYVLRLDKLQYSATYILFRSTSN